MSDTIQFQSRVGDDGILDIHVDLGRSDAAKNVVVTIKPLPVDDDAKKAVSADWHDFIEETYGSCAGSGLERPEQGTMELREPIA